jgi:hypothetical protein
MKELSVFVTIAVLRKQHLHLILKGAHMSITEDLDDTTEFDIPEPKPSQPCRWSREASAAEKRDKDRNNPIRKGEKK